ncbi:MAG: glycoside hydrolase family 88 protein [Cyclobacteriaceae bacterium]
MTLLVSFVFSDLRAQRGEAYFDNWPVGTTPEEVGRKVTIKFLNSPHSPQGIAKANKPITKITYREVCTWLGGLWFAEAAADEQLLSRLEDRFTPLFSSESHLQPPLNHVDNNVFGALPLELYQQTGMKEYLDLGLKYADAQWELPGECTEVEKHWSDKGYSWQTRIWIDDMFMITALQNQAFLATNDNKYIDRAAKEMVLYLDEIQLENGLFYHAPSAHYSWGRGNGWMAVGMTELLKVLPESNSDRKRIMQGYLSMMNALKKNQSKEGMWRQIIDDEQAWKETSATAMFTYAFIIGVKEGWLKQDEYAPAARRGWLALVSYLDENNELTEVCVGTGIKNDRDHYLNRPKTTGDLHGQAPLLWCAAALTNLNYE